MAGATATSAIGYFKSLTVIYALLAVLGLIPATQDLFGLAPIHGNDVWLHGGLALVAAYSASGLPQATPNGLKHLPTDGAFDPGGFSGRRGRSGLFSRRGGGSSAGRAPGLQPGGRGFESHPLHGVPLPAERFFISHS